ncbi:hypothetical protein M0813_16188 [Anaeramoeba flamelloides]|uniref:Uncharacterized protein n=1 Tax=Anaeramoeba flamelloides TaxID=1746091 RepID=A0ABQ8Z0N7_9EUKA|nr:hypothetical protein M0813_16188 [Anaeramoeba flamelloides]
MIISINNPKINNYELNTFQSINLRLINLDFEKIKNKMTKIAFFNHLYDPNLVVDRSAKNQNNKLPHPIQDNIFSSFRDCKPNQMYLGSKKEPNVPWIQKEPKEPHGNKKNQKQNQKNKRESQNSFVGIVLIFVVYN